MQRPIMTVVTLTAVLALAATANVSAADSDPAGITPIGGLAFAEEIELTVVNVLVYVTDKNGLAVTDLTAKDFKIFQDSDERPISNFDLFTTERVRAALETPLPPITPVATDAQSVAAAAETRPVYMVIYVDNQNLRPMDRNRTLRQLRAFVTETLHPPVQMMVVTYDRSVKVVVPFTSESDEVNAALRAVVMETGGRQTVDQSRKDLLDRMRRYEQDPGASQTNSRQAVYSQVIAFAEEEGNRLSFTLSALRQVLTTMSGLPGRKSILYLSNGLPMVAGQEMIYAFANTYDDPSALTLQAQFDQSRNFKSLVAAANAQDVSFYTVDAGGLQAVGIASAENAAPQDTISASIGDQNYKDSLRYVADGTGGAAILNTNDITEGLAKVSQDFFTYYSLGYQLTVSGADKVHDVKVELVGHPDYGVRYRRRFVEKSLETRVQDRVVSGLYFPVDDNPMQLDLVAGSAAPASEERWILPVELSFPLRKVALLPEGDDYVGRVVLFVAARASDGGQSDIVRQEHEVRVAAAEYETAQRQRFTIGASMLMESGSFKIVTGLLDVMTRQASYQSTTAVIAGDGK